MISLAATPSSSTLFVADSAFKTALSPIILASPELEAISLIVEIISCEAAATIESFDEASSIEPFKDPIFMDISLAEPETLVE